MAVDDAVADAARALYAVPPDEFMAARADLAKRAKSAGKGAAAAQIEKLRKPTVSAWVVNALVLDDPAVVDRLTELGDRLRAAQEGLDAAALRELSTERRALVDELTRKALARAENRQPTAGLRDEVSGTFEAAIAEPEVAGRLGRLQRAEQWSGFGFLPTAAPQFTVVRGEKGRPAAPAKKTGAPKKSAAERRRQQRELAAAQSAVESAETAFTEAQAGERDLVQRVKQLTKRLAKLQDELDRTREALDAARKEMSSTRARRRDARTALDRAERAAQD